MRLSDKQYASALLIPAALFMVLFIVYPIVLLFIQSFQEVSIFAPNEGVFVGLEQYDKALSSERVGGAFLRTLIYTVIALGAEFVIGFAAALLFDSLGKKSAIPRTIFLFPLMIPPVVAGLLWRFILIDNFGILNWLLYWFGVLQDPGAISWLSNENVVLYSVAFPNIWLTTCFVALILYTGLQNVPRELLQAAKIDGANALQIFKHVILPLLRPVIAVVLIIRGIDAARTFDMIWILTEGGPSFASEIVSLQIYRTMIRYSRVGEASAVAVLFMFALLFFCILLFYSIWKPEKASK